MAIDIPSDSAAARPREGATAPAPRPTTAVPAAGPRRRVVVDGVAFDALREDDVVDHVMRALRQGEGGSLVTPNVDILRQLRKPGLRHLADADLVVPDGMPIVWASRIQGDPLAERVTGSSLIWSLSRAAAAEGRSIYLLGGAEGVAERAGSNLRAAVPGVSIAGWDCPPLGFERSQEQLDQVRDAVMAATPDIVFVALGFPKQERLGMLLRQSLPHTWFVGCGGTLTMVAGEVSRAPEWVQRGGLEWLHRLAMEPRRMARRYLVDDAPYAVGLMVRSVLRGLRRRRRRESAA